MGEQDTSAGSRKPLCQDRAGDSVQPSEEVAVMSRPADHVPEMDRRAHEGRQGEGCCHVGNAGSGQKCRHLAESAFNKPQTIPKYV